MVKIKFILLGRWNVTHFLRHICAVVTDMDSQQSLLINFPFRSNARGFNTDAELQASDFGRIKNHCCMGVATLYSQRDFAQFVQLYNFKFGPHKQYGCFFNNCSDAVAFALDYFFPELNCERMSYRALQLLCGLGCVVTLGLCACIPALPVFTTPQDIYNRAVLLERRYGSPAPSTEPSAEPTAAVPSRVFLHPMPDTDTDFVMPHFRRFI